MEVPGRLTLWPVVGACGLMAFQYVAFLYFPSLLFASPTTPRQHLLRRFACATISTAFSLALSFRLLISADVAPGFDSFGFQAHHWWQAITFPLILVSMLYLGPLVAAVWESYDEWTEDGHRCLNQGDRLYHACLIMFENSKSLVFNIYAWKNLVVAPLTEEIVFRGCMLPLLLCAGFRAVHAIFLCPLFFGLAHANHFWELIYQQNCSKKRAFAIVGLQLGYTTVFGWYACFLFLRTGNLLAPLVTHIFCNIMGFPDFNEVLKRSGAILSLFAGLLGFSWMLFPVSDPVLYNDKAESCPCWAGYCKWG